MLKKPIAFTLIALTQTACGGSATEVALTPLVQTQHCPITEPGLSLYRTPESFAQALKADQPFKTAFTPDSNEAAVNKTGQIKLEPGHWAIVINLGSKPSAGYALELASPEGIIKEDTLTIHLEATQPAPGTMQATVMTMPCVIVATPNLERTVQRIEAKAADQRWQHSLAGDK